VASADFGVDKTEVVVEEDIQFSDLSSSDVTSWLWDFGNGCQSFLRNPTFAYSAAGTYTVSLTALNQKTSDIERKINHITVYPVASDFEWRLSFQTEIAPNMYGICEINELVQYNDRLYAAVGPAGEFYEFDGSEWSLVYRLPTDYEYEGCIATFWNSIIYNNTLYFVGLHWNIDSDETACVVCFDGSNWSRTDVTKQERAEWFDIEEYSGKLYAGGWQGRIYRLDDTWELLYTLPDSELIASLHMYEGKLFVGCENDSGTIYSFDGLSWVKEIDLDSPVLGMEVLQEEDLLFISCGDGRVFSFDAVEWTERADLANLYLHHVENIGQGLLFTVGTDSWPDNTKGELWLYDGHTDTWKCLFSYLGGGLNSVELYQDWVWTGAGDSTHASIYRRSLESCLQPGQ